MSLKSYFIIVNFRIFKLIRTLINLYSRFKNIFLKNKPLFKIELKESFIRVMFLLHSILAYLTLVIERYSPCKTGFYRK